MHLSHLTSVAATQKHMTQNSSKIPTTLSNTPTKQTKMKRKKTLSQFSILQININGLCSPPKQKLIDARLKAKKSEIVILVDTRLTPGHNDTFRGNLKGYSLTSVTSYTQSRGVSILIKKGFPLQIKRIHKDEVNSNYLMMECKIYNRRINIMGIYGPNTDSPTFYERIFDIILSNDPQHFLIAGDFNIAQNQDIDTKNYVNVNNPRAKEVLLSKMEEMNVRDHWRDTHPTSTDTTWKKANDTKEARLDFCLTSQNLQPFITDTQIGAIITDHAEVQTTIDLNKYPGGKKPWRLKQNLLYDPEYIQKVRHCIKEEQLKCIKKPGHNQSLWVYHRENRAPLQHYMNLPPEELNGMEKIRNARVAMDEILKQVQIISKAHEKEKMAEHNNDITNLTEEIERLREQDNVENEETQQDIQRASNSLKDKLEQEALRNSIHRETEWAKCGERLTPTLASLE